MKLVREVDLLELKLKETEIAEVEKDIFEPIAE